MAAATSATSASAPVVGSLAAAPVSCHEPPPLARRAGGSRARTGAREQGLHPIPPLGPAPKARVPPRQRAGAGATTAWPGRFRPAPGTIPANRPGAVDQRRQEQVMQLFGTAGGRRHLSPYFLQSGRVEVAQVTRLDG